MLYLSERKRLSIMHCVVKEKRNTCCNGGQASRRHVKVIGMVAISSKSVHSVQVSGVAATSSRIARSESFCPGYCGGRYKLENLLVRNHSVQAIGVDTISSKKPRSESFIGVAAISLKFAQSEILCQSDRDGCYQLEIVHSEPALSTGQCQICQNDHNRSVNRFMSSRAQGRNSRDGRELAVRSSLRQEHPRSWRG
jgi:hypothetical protein